MAVLLSDDTNKWYHKTQNYYALNGDNTFWIISDSLFTFMMPRKVAQEYPILLYSFYSFWDHKSIGLSTPTYLQKVVAVIALLTQGSVQVNWIKILT